MARIVALIAMMVTLVPAALAEPFKVDAMLTMQESLRLDFQDGSGHFVLMVRREGTAEGNGPLAGGSVVEYGWHDVMPGVAGDPHGYLEVTAPGGDIAYLRFLVRGVFLSKPDGSARLADDGYWELVSGTGAFAGQRGVGGLVITPASKTESRFTLEGEITDAPGG